MSVILKKDSWKIKDPNTGEYRDSAVFSTFLPEEAASVIADAAAAITAQETRAAGIIADATAAITAQETRAAGVISDAQDDVDIIAAAVASMAQTGTDTTLTVSGAAADSKAVGNKFAEQSEAITSLIGLTNTPIPFAIVATGYVNSSDGTTASSTTASYTDYIDVSVYKSITYKRMGYTSSNVLSGMAFYNSSKEYISGVIAAASRPSQGYVSPLYTANVPSGAKYARFSTFTNTTTYGEFEIYGESLLKNVVDDISEAIDVYSTAENDFVYGSILDATGGYYIVSGSDTNKYIVSKGYYSFKDGQETISFDRTSLVANPVAYENGRYIGKLRTTGSFATTGTVNYITSFNLVDYPDYEFKFIAKHSDGTVVSLDETENVTIKSSNIYTNKAETKNTAVITESISEVDLGCTLISANCFTNKSANCTVTINTQNNELTITNGSSGDTTYRIAGTPNSFIQGVLEIGKTYRFHAKANVVSGNPIMMFAIRGSSTSTSGLVKTKFLYDGEDNFIDFTVNEYMRDICFYSSYNANKPDASVKFSEIWLKEIKGVSAKDIEYRESSKCEPQPIGVHLGYGGLYIEAGQPFLTLGSQNARLVMKPYIHIPKDSVYRFKANGFDKYIVIKSLDGKTLSNTVAWKTAKSIDMTIKGEMYVRFAFAKSDNSNISPEEVSIQVWDVTHIDVTNNGVIAVDSTPIGRNIVCSYGHSYVKNENGILKLSTNSGKTWNDGVDVTSVSNDTTISSYHLFGNNTLAFFTNQKAYYIDGDDWTQFAEATVYEADGTTPYVPSTYDNFYQTKDSKYRKVVDGKEFYVFGNYGTRDEENTRRLIWFSNDDGHTYKPIYEFNISGTYYIRHVHTVAYNPNTDTYLCCTGDSAQQSRVIEITFDDSDDSWTFTTLGNNLNYKWASIDFYSNEVYYCFDQVPGKVMKCKYSDISDTTKHELVIDNLPNDVIGVFIGERGDMLVSLSRYRSVGASNSAFTLEEDTRRLYYSEDREHFYNFIGNNETERDLSIYYGFFSVNDDGKILCGMTTGAATWDKMPSVFLDDMVKRQGFQNAFKPYDRDYEIVPVLAIECNDVTVASGSTATITPKIYPFNATKQTYDVIGYDTSVATISGSTITGVAQGTTTATIRSKTNWDVTKTITITVT